MFNVWCANTAIKSFWRCWNKTLFCHAASWTSWNEINTSALGILAINSHPCKYKLWSIEILKYNRVKDLLKLKYYRIEATQQCRVRANIGRGNSVLGKKILSAITIRRWFGRVVTSGPLKYHRPSLCHIDETNKSVKRSSFILFYIDGEFHQQDFFSSNIIT